MIGNRVRMAASYAVTVAAMSMGAMATMTGAAQADEPGSAQARGGEYAGCPYGAVCLYPDDSWNGGNPEHIYWTYGVHKLSDEYGMHRLFNNQSGDATAQACRGADGTDCGGEIPPWEYRDGDLTPGNSIRLDP